jgi:hypothetical protein
VQERRPTSISVFLIFVKQTNLLEIDYFEPMPVPIHEMQQQQQVQQRSVNNGHWNVQLRRPGETGTSSSNMHHHIPEFNDPLPQHHPNQLQGTATVTGPLDRLNDRLVEIERVINPPVGRRHQQMTNQQISAMMQQQQQGHNVAAPMPSIPMPPTAYGQGNTQLHHTAANILIPPLAAQNNPGWNPGAPPQNPYSFAPPQQNQAPGQPRPYTAPMLYPPPPPYQDDIFKDFSQCNQQEYFLHEARLYQRINFHSKIRLGYGKAISVLQRQLEESQEYQRIIRPYQIDQPTNLPELSPLIPNSEARLFADTVRALVDIIGLQRSVHVLETAKVGDVPGIKYEIQRVPIPSRNTPPIPLEPEFIPIEQPKPAEIGPFARSRTNSFSSMASTSPTSGSWGSPIGMSMDLSPPAPPPSAAEDDFPSPLPTEEMLPPPISAPPTPHRGILRRTSSGTSLNGKRVTIQTDSGCRCTSRFCHANRGTSFEHGGQHVMSPIPISPVKVEDGQIAPMELGNDFQHRMHSRISHEGKPSTPEEVILQQMAAAQM